jgi:hypothetical protein
LPTVTDPAGLSIDGGGDVKVSDGGAVQVFVVGRGAALSSRSLTVSAGADFDFGLGGAIRNDGGTLTVTDSTVTGNDAGIGSGGGISNIGGGALTISNSTFSANFAFSYGGVFNGQDAELTVSGSTFSGNGAEAGGGIHSAGPLTVTNATLHGNDALVGGGVFVRGTATLRNTVVADNPGGNCAGLPTDGGYNIDDDGTCGFTRASGSLPDTDPLLDPNGLQDNGGPTETIALKPDSPAVDLVAEGACPPPATDRRGVGRPQGEACDSGAFELRQRSPHNHLSAP